MPRAKKSPVLPVGTGERRMPDVPPGRAYGARKATEESIAAAPTAGPSVPEGAAPAADPAAMLAAAQAYNPTGPGLTDPSENPNEPVTEGLATGPGEGPAGLNLPAAPNEAATTADFLRTLYTLVPAAKNNDMLRLIELAEREQWT